MPAFVPIGHSVQSSFSNDAAGSGSDDVLAGRALWIPYWLVVVTTLILPAVMARRVYLWRRRARRLAANQCAGCGFDLRASAERCPECGTPISNQPSGEESLRSR